MYESISVRQKKAFTCCIEFRNDFQKYLCSKTIFFKLLSYSFDNNIL